ncbi:MAG: CoA transferase [SAR202 cluster bacterium]|nr:CoA transferase [SAR202 cluster bacterium]
MAGALEGIRILDFTEIIAGPLATMLLADMGAEVIKVEPPWGDPWRFSREFIPGESHTYISLNRGKRSLPLDLTRVEGREVVGKLVRDADVVVVNYRPDVPAKLGIDYEALSKINPRIIYCENTAYGRRGPHSSRPGYDLIIQAMSGIVASEGKIVNGVPQHVVSSALADFATGIAMAWGISAALYSRERTGEGQKIETTLLATALMLQASRFLQVDAEDLLTRNEVLNDLETMRRKGRPFSEVHHRVEEAKGRPPGNIYYRNYETSDGVIAVGCLSDTLRRKLANVLSIDDIRFKPGYDPTAPEAKQFGQELMNQVEAIFRSRATSDWINLLDGAGIPCGPVRFIEELIDDEQVQANDLVVELEHALAGSLRMVGPILRMTETPLHARSASPALGQHTDEIFLELGYSPDEIERLRKLGVTR